MIFSNEILGGLLVGLASALPLLWEGRIAGVSGYAATSLRPRTPEARTSLAFVVGLVLGGFAWRGAGFPLAALSAEPLWLWGLAGLLVGFGSRLGGGCTSGHGVCGLGRISPRSFVSVLIFMSVAILTRVSMQGLK